MFNIYSFYTHVSYSVIVSWYINGCDYILDAVLRNMVCFSVMLLPAAMTRLRRSGEASSVT